MLPKPEQGACQSPIFCWHAAAKALFLLAGGLEFGPHRVHNNPFPLKKFILDAASIPKKMAKRWQVESMVLRAIKGAGRQLT